MSDTVSYDWFMDDEEYNQLVIAARLREARTVLGLTQADTATALDIPRSGVADLETGKRNISGTELRMISRLYRRPVAWLIGAEDHPPVNDETLQAIDGLSEQCQQTILAFARFLAHQTTTTRHRS